MTTRGLGFSLFAALVFVCANSFAITEEELLKQIQIGKQWGKTSVNHDQLAKGAEYERVGLYVAQFRQGSAFLIKTSGNKLYMATNAHVVVFNDDVLVSDLSDFQKNRELACHYDNTMESPVQSVRFDALGIEAPCTKILGIWPEIDLAIFEISPSDLDRAALSGRGISLIDYVSPMVGQPLAMFGYGQFMNPGQGHIALMRSEDQDCAAYSGKEEFRSVADPDQHSPGKYKAWAFPIGCDVSWGDSGSPVLDRHTGKFVGIIYTGVFPKDPAVAQDETFLSEARKQYQSKVWDVLNYAVPAQKIVEVLSRTDSPWRTPDNNDEFKKILSVQ